MRLTVPGSPLFCTGGGPSLGYLVRFDLAASVRQIVGWIKARTT
jgi:hypothetical protein